MRTIEDEGIVKQVALLPSSTVDHKRGGEERIHCHNRGRTIHRRPIQVAERHLTQKITARTLVLDDIDSVSVENARHGSKRPGLLLQGARQKRGAIGRHPHLVIDEEYQIQSGRTKTSVSRGSGSTVVPHLKDSGARKPLTDQLQSIVRRLIVDDKTSSKTERS